MKRTLIALVLAATGALQAAALAEDKRAPLAVGGEVFAVVGGVVVTGAEFERAYRQAVRRKYYHRQPPEGEVNALRREVGDALIHRVLLLAESKRRGLTPDTTKIDKAIAEYDTRYAGSPQWRQRRESLLPELKRHLGEQDVLERLETSVRAGPPASDAQARAYYDAHRDKFTEPAKVDVSVILLSVAPSSPQVAWDKAREEAARVVAQLRAGADFGEMARLRSGDPSAGSGGSLGYLHRGMLPEPVQKVVDGMQPGAISAPVTVLEGVAILRLEGRKPAKVLGFADVKARAAALWERERSEKMWSEFLARLRAGAVIEVDASRYPPASAGEKGA